MESTIYAEHEGEISQALIKAKDANHKKAKEVWNKVLNSRCFFSREHKSIYEIKRNEL
ncbi:MAG: hypothetical protein U0586_00365 [Candidatus Brocadiaceae bacterium]